MDPKGSGLVKSLGLRPACLCPQPHLGMWAEMKVCIVFILGGSVGLSFGLENTVWRGDSAGGGGCLWGGR